MGGRAGCNWRPTRCCRCSTSAFAGVTGRDRELELRLGVAAPDRGVHGSGADGPAGRGARSASPACPATTQGECELLLHAALHRFVRGRAADDVAELLERAVAAPAVAGRGRHRTAFHIPFVVGQLYKGDRLGKARELVDWQLAESARRGSAPGFVLASVNRAWIALREGDAIAAEADARAAYDLVTDVAWHRHFAAAALADVLVDRGALGEARGGGRRGAWTKAAPGPTSAAS